VRKIALGFAAVLLACSGAPAPEAPARPERPEGRYARVEVAVAPAVAGQLPADAAAALARAVRQSARDWLEQGNRLAPDGELSLVVNVESARLRSACVALLFAWATAPDHLAARVLVLRGAEPVANISVRAESALSGWEWRDPGQRLDRLARRLGQRVVEGL
jgi:hypothetical protein